MAEHRGFDAILFATYGCLLWKVYKDAHTSINEASVSRPALRGRVEIPWTEVRQVTRFRQLGDITGLHIHGERTRIAISAYAYRDPRGVISAVLEYASSESIA